MIDKKMNSIYKPDGDSHYHNGIPKQHKTDTLPSPLLKKMLGQKEKKIELFQVARTPGKSTFNEYIIFCRKYLGLMR